MFKETITYTDFNGVQQTEDFYFNFTTAELTKMELYHGGNLEDHLQQIVNSGDGRKIINAFEEIIRDAYGKRTEDGKGFVKSQEITQEFVASNAYSEFFMKIIQEPDYATEFIRGIVPADLAAKAAAAEAQNGFRPGAQTLPQSEVERRAQRDRENAAAVDALLSVPPHATPTVEDGTQVEAGQQIAVTDAAPVEAAQPALFEEDTQPTDSPEVQAAREAALQQSVDGSLPEDPLVPGEPGYEQGLTRRQARELGLL